MSFWFSSAYQPSVQIPMCEWANEWMSKSSGDTVDKKLDSRSFYAILTWSTVNHDRSGLGPSMARGQGSARAPRGLFPASPSPCQAASLPVPVHTGDIYFAAVRKLHSCWSDQSQTFLYGKRRAYKRFSYVWIYFSVKKLRIFWKEDFTRDIYA